MLKKNVSLAVKYTSLSIMLTSSFSAMSFQHESIDLSLKGPRGDVRTKSCIEINGNIPHLKAELSTWIEDLRSGNKGDAVNGSAKIDIPAGEYQKKLFCSQPEMLGEINNEGLVHYNWSLFDGNSNTLVKNFKTYADFDGSQASNDWDINEQGQCSTVYLGFKGNNTCGWLWNVPDEDYVTAYYAPDLSDLTPEETEVATYRVNLGLLMASFDGLRYTDGLSDVFDGFFGKPIGEIIRRADQFAQQSELKGKIAARLPDGSEYVLLDTKEQTIPVNFLETHLKTFTFSLPKNAATPEKITIECNVREIDSDYGSDDLICEGTKEYKLQKFEQNKVMPSAVIGSNNNVVESIVEIFNGIGYDKLYADNEYGTLSKIITLLMSKPAEFWDLGYLIAHPIELNDVIKGVSGIYVMNANIEKLDNYSNMHSLSKIDWNFYSLGTKSEKSATNEPYGQLYYMPQAVATDADGLVSMIFEGGTLDSLLTMLGVEIDQELLAAVKLFPIPFYWGEAIPLFDLNRQDALDSEYQSAEQTSFKTTVSHVKPKNGSLGAYFVNMWERDGDSAIEVDECLAKGNAFGLQNSADGYLRLDSCNYTNETDSDDYVDVNTSLNSFENNTDDEYLIEGELTFTTTDGAGGAFEAYGKLALQNKGHEFYNTQLEPDQTAVLDGKEQKIRFSSTFKSSEMHPAIIADINIQESDSGEDDQIVVANRTLDYQFGVTKTIELGGGKLTYKVSKAAKAN